jgi:hypothetical protein
MSASSAVWVGLALALSAPPDDPRQATTVRCLVDVGSNGGEDVTIREATLPVGQSVDVSIAHSFIVRIQNGLGHPAQISISVDPAGDPDDSLGAFLLDRSSNPLIVLDMTGVVTTADQRAVAFDHLIVDCALTPSITRPTPRALRQHGSTSGWR